MLKAGIIGCGAIAERRHARFMCELPGRLAVAAVAAAAAERQKVIGDMCGVGADHWHADYRDMLAKEELDFVTICTPHHLHRQPTLDALDAGVNVLIEKPLALNVAECDEMIAKSKETGKSLCVLHNQLFSSGTLELLRILESGDMGKPFFVRTEVVGKGPYVGRGVDGGWRTRTDSCGVGSLIDSGYHQVYRALAFMGSPITKVYAKMGKYTDQFEFDDLAVVIYEHENGGVTCMQSGWCALAGATGVKEILLTGGTIKPTIGGTEKLTIRRNGADKDEAIEMPKPAPDDLGASTLLERFVTSLEQGLPSPCPPEDGREIMRILDAALESSATGQAVKL